MYHCILLQIGSSFIFSVLPPPNYAQQFEDDFSDDEEPAPSKVRRCYSYRFFISISCEKWI